MSMVCVCVWALTEKMCIKFATVVSPLFPGSKDVSRIKLGHDYIAPYVTVYPLLYCMCVREG